MYEEELEEKKTAEVLTVGEACKAILRPTPSFKATTFPSSVFSTELETLFRISL